MERPWEFCIVVPPSIDSPGGKDYLTLWGLRLKLYSIWLRGIDCGIFSPSLPFNFVIKLGWWSRYRLGVICCRSHKLFWPVLFMLWFCWNFDVSFGLLLAKLWGVSIFGRTIWLLCPESWWSWRSLVLAEEFFRFIFSCWFILSIWDWQIEGILLSLLWCWTCRMEFLLTSDFSTLFFFVFIDSISYF